MNDKKKTLKANSDLERNQTNSYSDHHGCPDHQNHQKSNPDNEFGVEYSPIKEMQVNQEKNQQKVESRNDWHKR